MKHRKSSPPLCEFCKVPMRIIHGRNRKFYGCPNFPTCKHTLPLSLGIPMGIPHEDAGNNVKALRREVHRLLNQIWDYDNLEQRGKMYRWLKKNTKYGHVSMMKESELKRVIPVLQVMVGLHSI